jgi:anion-transporting  ArsA/GET3 family ATPase
MIGLLDRRVVFVTGKGGVGKTTVSTALALLAAQQGRKTLLCEVDAKGDVASYLEVSPSSFSPRKVIENLWIMSMDTEASLREYLKLNLRIPVAGRIGPLAKAFDFVATAAPGVREILTVGKLCYEVREENYDLVVVDAAATGHIVGQLAAPQAINELVRVGLVRSQTGWMLDILSDPSLTGLAITTTPEEMPVNETMELAERVAKETTVQLAAVVVNRVLPELFGRSEEEVFEKMRRPGARKELATLVGGDPVALLDAARMAVNLRRNRAAHLDRLHEGLDPAVPVMFLPELFIRSHGLRTSRRVALHLGEELGL